MKQQILAQRYAKALFQLAVERDELETVLADLQSFASALQSSDELGAVFVNPVFAAEQREAIVQEIASRLELGKTTNNYLLLLLRKKRTALFEESVVLFQQLLDDRAQRKNVRVVSATALSEEYLAQLKDKLEAETQGDVTIETTVDPTLVGGVVTWIGDRLYDGSLRTRLDNLKEQLLNQIR